jgi:hypothetical protein
MYEARYIDIIVDTVVDTNFPFFYSDLIVRFILYNILLFNLNELFFKIKHFN